MKERSQFWGTRVLKMSLRSKNAVIVKVDFQGRNYERIFIFVWVFYHVFMLEKFYFFAVCDFFGERMAALLGLNAAKYQYVIDQYHRHHQVSTSTH